MEKSIGVNKTGIGGVYTSKMKRILSSLVAIAFLIVVASTAHFLSINHSNHVDAVKLVQAAKTYVDDLRMRGQPVPPVISLTELISHGLLTRSDVSGFEGMDVTINPAPDENRPSDILVRARLANGWEVVALADGSVQQWRR